MPYAPAMHTIRTDRLLLRPFRMSDAEAVARLCDNERVYRGTLSLPHPYTVACAEAWIAGQEENIRLERGYEFAIVDRASGELYGCVGLFQNAANRSGEAGYWIGEPHWGNGFATEALEALLAFAFSEKGLNRVFARHFASNPASGRVMAKCGMRREGVLREHILKDGTFEDVVCCGLLRGEWLARREGREVL